jgi:hypothetical protein
MKEKHGGSLKAFFEDKTFCKIVTLAFVVLLSNERWQFKEMKTKDS